MVTGQATQKLEDVLKGQPSEEEAKVSEEPTDVEPTDEVKSEKAVEGEKLITFTPEQEAEITRRVNSERDKHTNLYREKREADMAYIRSLNDQNKELRKGNLTKQGNKRMEAILAGDEEEGLEEDKIKSRGIAFKEFQSEYEEYQTKITEVAETADFISKVTANLPAYVIKNNGLDDPNPNIRASNGMKFIDATISGYQFTQNFLMAMEAFLPKGDELRQQIEGIVDGMAEFESDKSKKLYLKDQLRGVNVIARKKPPAPSDGSGGPDLSKLSAEEKMTLGLEEERKKHKIT